MTNTISDDLRNIKARVTLLEEAVAGVNRRLDRLDARMDRIEKLIDQELRRDPDLT